MNLRHCFVTDVYVTNTLIVGFALPCAMFAVGPNIQIEFSVLGIVTWLILPVVICLSQRLSHACLSINKFVL